MINVDIMVWSVKQQLAVQVLYLQSTCGEPEHFASGVVWPYCQVESVQVSHRIQLGKASVQPSTVLSCQERCAGCWQASTWPEQICLARDSSLDMPSQCWPQHEVALDHQNVITCGNKWANAGKYNYIKGQCWASGIKFHKHFTSLLYGG
jgi:hypothetical protein